MFKMSFNPIKNIMKTDDSNTKEFISDWFSEKISNNDLGLMTILFIEPLLLIVLTLLIASPVFCEFRYMYCVLICMPLVIFGYLYGVRHE